MVENHPFEPWLPGNAKLLMLGTFPPAEKRWCMPWYYPNFQNDMWRIFGIIYFQDKFHFVDVEKKTYRLDAIKKFLGEKGVAIYDTAQQVIRTKNTASDKDLQIVQPADLDGMLRQLPHFWHQGKAWDGRLCRISVRGPQTPSVPHALQFPCLSYGSGEEG